jgi:ActR/RegA family two-component response regulator
MSRRTNNPRILLFDDDERFAETWAEILSNHAFEVKAETDPRVVRRTIEATHFDAVLLDLDLDRKADDNYRDGLDVLLDVAVYSSDTRVIVLSGPATPEGVSAALRLGACDFVDKKKLTDASGRCETFLVERLNEAITTPPIKLDPTAGRENQIQFLWASRDDGTPHRRGRILEQLMKVFFESLPHFGNVMTNLTISSLEIDLTISHNHPEPYWAHFGGEFLGECKHWANENPVDYGEFTKFEKKVMQHRALGKLGFFVSLSGFAPAFLDQLRTFNRTSDVRIVPLGPDVLEALVAFKQDPGGRLRLLQDSIRKSA